MFFPGSDKLSFDNPIVGFVHKYTNSDTFHGMNYIQKDGTKSQLQEYLNNKDGWKESRLSENAQVRKVIIYGRPSSEFGGLEIFDAQGTKLLTAGSIVGEKRVIELKDGERLLGVKAKHVNSANK